MASTLFVLGLIGTIIGIIAFFYNLTDPQGCRKSIVVSAIVTVVFLLISLVTFKFSMNNYYYAKNQEIGEAMARIEIMKTRETDLREALVPLVKGYVKHESGLLNAVKNRSVEHLLALFERYPELKANENFMKLMDDLIDLRDGVVKAKLYYNKSAKDYNATAKQWPFKFFVPENLPKQVEFIE